MAKTQKPFAQKSTPAMNWSLTARKAGLSMLVVAGFAVYAAHERLDAPIIASPAASANSSANSASTTQTNTTTSSSTAASGFKDGTYTGPSVDAYYGNVQVKVTVQNGRISNVQFLDYPHDRRTSQEINAQAMPYLNQEAIQVQSAQVDIISGATFTSQGFTQSLQAALQQAQSVAVNVPAAPDSSNAATVPTVPAANPPAASAGYKDGTYTGPSIDAYYGNVQVKATIQGGRITDVQFLDYPHDRRTSQQINSYAMPNLNQEAIQAQSAQVDIISGATFTSEGFTQSLQAVLQQAKS